MITVLSLLLLLATIGVVFVARAALQYRRTGDAGWRAPSRAVDPSQAGARLAMAVAFLLLLAAPIVDLAGRLPLLWSPGAMPRLAGLVAATVAAVAVVLAQLEMGASWRVGVDPGESTALVTRGAFGWVRNPIFTAMIVFVVGQVIAVPNPVAVAGGLLAVIGIQWQVRGIEEPYLLRVHGDSYRGYAGRTGRFLPGIGRLGRS